MFNIDSKKIAIYGLIMFINMDSKKNNNLWFNHVYKHG